MKFRVIGSPLHYLEQSDMMDMNQEEEVKVEESQFRRESLNRLQTSKSMLVQTSGVALGGISSNSENSAAAMH